MSTYASAVAQQKKRWSREEKRQRHERQSRGLSNNRPTQGIRPATRSKPSSLTVSEQLLQCAEKVASTQAVMVKSSHDSHDASDSNVDEGNNVRVITSSNLLAVDESLLEGVSKTIIVKPLLILDLNGILCHRIRKDRTDLHPYLPYRKAIDQIAGTPIIPRDGIDTFLEDLLAHFCLAVWTSAKPKTAKLLLKSLFHDQLLSGGRLLFVWSQHQCERREEKRGDDEDGTVFLKPLSKVWETYPLWNPSNTLLMDDSPNKCPELQNTLHPPPLHGKEALPDLAETFAFMSDAENGARQEAFFHSLVEEYFAEPRVTWPDRRAEEAFGKALHRLARKHMGWRGECQVDSLPSITT
jgi:hypothetical protein